MPKIPTNGRRTRGEDGLLKVIEKLELKRSSDEFQKALGSDVAKTKNSEAVFVPADKTKKLLQK